MTIPTHLDSLLAHDTHVRQLARNLVRSDQEADDLVQDTWVSALEGEGRPTRSERGMSAASDSPALLVALVDGALPCEATPRAQRAHQ